MCGKTAFDVGVRRRVQSEVGSDAVANYADLFNAQRRQERADAVFPVRLS